VIVVDFSLSVDIARALLESEEEIASIFVQWNQVLMVAFAWSTIV
jgi:hypothetical protein